MKIGIITILKVNNYGAELQAYATQAVLNRMGYEAEIIDYLFYKNPKHKTTRLLFFLSSDIDIRITVSLFRVEKWV